MTRFFCCTMQVLHSFTALGNAANEKLSFLRFGREADQEHTVFW